MYEFIVHFHNYGMVITMVLCWRLFLSNDKIVHDDNDDDEVEKETAKVWNKNKCQE